MYILQTTIHTYIHIYIHRCYMKKKKKNVKLKLVSWRFEQRQYLYFRPRNLNSKVINLERRKILGGNRNRYAYGPRYTRSYALSSGRLDTVSATLRCTITTPTLEDRFKLAFFPTANLCSLLTFYRNGIYHNSYADNIFGLLRSFVNRLSTCFLDFRMH